MPAKATGVESKQIQSFHENISGRSMVSILLVQYVIDSQCILKISWDL